MDFYCLYLVVSGDESYALRQTSELIRKTKSSVSVEKSSDTMTLDDGGALAMLLSSL